MNLQTTRHGHVEIVSVPPRDVIAFPRGPIGFEEHNRFALLGDPGQRPFYLLQSLLDPWTAFVVVDVRALWPNYRLSTVLSDADASQSGECPLILAIVTVGAEAEKAAANLLAPVVINRHRRQGRQVVQSEGVYSIAEPLFSGATLASAVGG